AIKKAKRSVEIIIFRFDQAEIESALIEAVERGVFVHALIAFTNKGGEQTLRRLEMRFLDKGITVARTADDLARYHGKMMLIDGIKITDRAMQHILEERFKAGLEIRVIGQITRNKNLLVRCPQNLRLHARVIIRDRTSIFLGSQSLRKLELDSRREIGVIVG